MTVNYKVSFERIGRNHDVPPACYRLAEGHDADELAFHIYGTARPYLLSSDVDVLVDLAAMKGKILTGFHLAGKFTIEQVGS